MNTEELIKYVRSSGCGLRLYKDRAYFSGYADAYFWRTPKPLIKVATKGKSQNLVRLLICHEFCHFLQWRDGFFESLENHYGPGDIYYKWIEGKGRDIKKAHRAMQGILLLEYDCELRALEFARNHNIKIGARAGHIRRINAYLANIKLDFENRKCSNFHSTFGFSSKIPSKEEVLLPLTDEERRLLT